MYTKKGNFSFIMEANKFFTKIIQKFEIKLNKTFISTRMPKRNF